MGSDTVRLSQPFEASSGTLRLIGGGAVKDTVTWAAVARYVAIIATAWQLFSYLDGMEKRLTAQITAVREEGIERRMEMRELQRRVGEIERRMETRGKP